MSSARPRVAAAPKPRCARAQEEGPLVGEHKLDHRLKEVGENELAINRLVRKVKDSA